jgi:methylated-DNA-[protein]-cysteine S-methyltransferase
MTTNLYTRIDSPLGRMLLTGSKDSASRRVSVTAILFDRAPHAKRFDLAGAEEDASAFARVVAQLEEYFAGRRTTFDLELAPRGTAFQLTVWRRLAAIPYGTTMTYGAIARELGRPTASRAVGAANGKNPIAIVVPCHRVIGEGGALTGYAGGMENKRALLDLEARTVSVQLALAV